VADLIENFCAETRKSLHEHDFAVSKHVRGFAIMSQPIE